MKYSDTTEYDLPHITLNLHTKVLYPVFRSDIPANMGMSLHTQNAKRVSYKSYKQTC